MPQRSNENTWTPNWLDSMRTLLNMQKLTTITDKNCNAFKQLLQLHPYWKYNLTTNLSYLDILWYFRRPDELLMIIINFTTDQLHHLQLRHVYLYIDNKVVMRNFVNTNFEFSIHKTSHFWAGAPYQKSDHEFLSESFAVTATKVGYLQGSSWSNF